MFQLLDKAYEWQKYGVCTTVAYSKCYGLSGPKYFQSLSYSSILDPCSNFYPYTVKFQKQPFKLNPQFFKNTEDIYRLISGVDGKEQKSKCNETIKLSLDILKNLATVSFCTRDEHLRRGKKTIFNLTSLPDKVCEKLCEKWTEVVNNSVMIPIREQITADFNTSVVHRFERLLGHNSPLQLIHMF